MGTSREDTTSRVCKILLDHLGVSQEQLQPAALLVPEHYSRGRKVADGKPDLGADSLDIVELVMAIEDEFGIEIPDAETEPLIRATVGELVDFVHERREAASWPAS